MDAFREPSSHEIQHTVLQFMGQNMGDFKQLDNSLISKNNTLQGMTLQPSRVIKSVPVSAPQQVKPTFQPTAQPVPIAPTLETKNPNDPTQLEFNFENTQYGKSILESLKEIVSLLEQQNKTLNSIKKSLTCSPDKISTSILPTDKKKED